VPFVIRAEFSSGAVAWVKAGAIGHRFCPRQNATVYKTHGLATQAVATAPTGLCKANVRFVIEAVDEESPTEGPNEPPG